MSGKRTGAGKLLCSSALYWFPKIRNAGLPVPTTRFVAVPRDYMAIIVGDTGLKPETKEAWERAKKSIATAALRIGYPVFLRTDLASAKHSGPQAYRILTEAGIDRVMAETLEDNEMKWLNPAAFMARRWLNLDCTFLAFGGHPIAREWRFFATKDRVICRNFYWPEDSIKFWGKVLEPAGWQGALNMMAHEFPPEELDVLAMRAARACSESDLWSVDFAKAKDGTWWLIDMAIAEESSHPWNGCSIPNTEKPRRQET